METELIKLLDEPVLCYVSKPFAYFTTLPLERQWGDDWNDAPYEYNAGTPYHWSEHDLEKHGKPRWEIIIVLFMGEFNTPDYGVDNSHYSVEMINRGDIAWLRPDEWNNNKNALSIKAGATVEEFKRLIWQGGGNIYELVKPPINKGGLCENC